MVDRPWSLDHVNSWSLHQGPPFESGLNYFLGCISQQLSVSKTSSWAKICSAAHRLYTQRELVWSISSSAMAVDHGAALWKLTQTHPASSHGDPQKHRISQEGFSLIKEWERGWGLFPIFRMGGRAFGRKAIPKELLF